MTLLALSAARVASAAPRNARGLASTLLLSRTETDWLSETAAQLKKEARARGLSQNGTKAEIARRLVRASQEEARAAMSTATPAAPVPAQRAFSSSVRWNRQESSNGKFTPRRPNYLDVKFPEPPVEVEEGPNIPYLPDNFGSDQAYSASPLQIPEETGPKVVTTAIGGIELHSPLTSTDGHAEELRQEAEELSEKAAESVATKARGFWAATFEELGLTFALPTTPATHSSPAPAKDTPSVASTSKAVVGDVLADLSSVKDVIAKPDVSKVEESDENVSGAKLDAEQKKGLYVLLGILVAGGTISKAVV